MRYPLTPGYDDLVFGNRRTSGRWVEYRQRAEDAFERCAGAGPLTASGLAKGFGSDYDGLELKLGATEEVIARAWNLCQTELWVAFADGERREKCAERWQETVGKALQILDIHGELSPLVPHAEAPDPLLQLTAQGKITRALLNSWPLAVDLLAALMVVTVTPPEEVGEALVRRRVGAELKPVYVRMLAQGPLKGARLWTLPTTGRDPRLEGVDDVLVVTAGPTGRAGAQVSVQESNASGHSHRRVVVAGGDRSEEVLGGFCAIDADSTHSALQRLMQTGALPDTACPHSPS